MRKTEGYVYFLKSPDNLYKIGKSIEITRRLKQIQPSYPHELEFFIILHTFNMSALENLFHKKFAHKRLNGEWFRLDEDDLVFEDCMEYRPLTYEEYLNEQDYLTPSRAIRSLEAQLLNLVPEGFHSEAQELINKLVAYRDLNKLHHSDSELEGIEEWLGNIND